MLEALQHRTGFSLVSLAKIGQALELGLLFLLGRADELEFLWHCRGTWIEEGIDTDDRIRAIVLSVLVDHRFFLDLAALVASLHRSEHASALGDRFELLQHRFFDQIGQLLDDERALVRILILSQTPFLVDHELDRHSAAHRLLGGRGDRLVVGVGVQGIGIVVGRDQRLERGANVVEGNLLGMERASRCLRMEFELLAALVRAVLVPHRHRPDASRHTSEHGVFGLHAVAEEKRQVRHEIVDLHSACEVGLDEREAVREGKGELRDRIRAGLCDVVSGDRCGVEIPHVVVDEILLDVAHHLERELGREDAGVLALVFLQNVRLHRAANS